MAYRLSRRGFLYSTALTAGAYGLTAACASETSGPQARNTGGAPKEVFTAPGRKLDGSLSVLMWSHFVPRHDKWFDRFAADWGKRVGVTVRVDHINTVDVPRRAASEIQAGRGHDVIQHIAPFSQYEPSVLDMGDVVQEANRRWGQQLELCRKSSYNPNTRRFYAYCPGWSPDPGDYRRSMWEKVGLPNGPGSWDELLRGASEIKRTTGVPCGIGLSPETDSNMAARALLWSYGASEQDANERVTINTDATVAAVDFIKEPPRKPRS
ncbi:extracellular solute-binding protein [Spirillospora sp. CA-255316]